jgi:hypothetical protein
LVNEDGGRFKDTGHFAPWNFWSDDMISGTYKEGDIVSSGDFSYKYINAEPSSGHFLTDTAYWMDLGYLKSITGFSSGVMPFRNDNDDSLFNSNYWSLHSNDYNIRRNSGYYPSVDNVTVDSAMNANVFGATKASLPSFVFSCPASGTRNAKVVYTYSFENYRGVNALQVRSFVGGYKDIAYGVSLGYGGDKNNLIPFFDALFSGMNNSTEAFVPNIQTGDSIVNYSTGAIIINSNLPYYNTLTSETNAIYPIFNTQLSWSVPCPNGVVGCP